ncbi:hypothetical protein DPMN_122217 [Dreissena polymorpha]|uniref:Uncharacterized protein n=1 Tax=Dreissena polymorpha TaxID=45954 RepID=A0A9D4GN59_DREPO|nr:hypothetical protein DPMN_122217 [Dreissena polymorpha]
MKIHAVFGQGNSKVLVGEKSCYCENCIGGIYNCRHWQKQTIVVISTSKQIDPEQETPIPVFDTTFQSQALSFQNQKLTFKS